MGPVSPNTSSLSGMAATRRMNETRPRASGRRSPPREGARAASSAFALGYDCKTLQRPHAHPPYTPPRESRSSTQLTLAGL